MKISIASILVGLCFWAFGIAMFVSMGKSQATREANLRMIETGEAQKVALTLDRKWVQKDTDKSTTHWASFSPYGESRWFTNNEWVNLAVGQTFDAHLVNGELIIAQLDILQPNARWTMLKLCGFLGSLTILLSFIVSLLPAGLLQRDLFNSSARKPVEPDHATTAVINKLNAARDKNLRPVADKNMQVNMATAEHAEQSMSRISAGISDQSKHR